MSAINQYVRTALHDTQTPPPIAVSFFYSSPLAIDDPLSPLPPPIGASAAPSREPPRPYSAYDNVALDKAWNKLRREISRWNEEQEEKFRSGDAEDGHGTDGKRMHRVSKAGRLESRGKTTVNRSLNDRTQRTPSAEGHGKDMNTSGLRDAAAAFDTSTSDTTGNPFVRAPSRRQLPFAGIKKPAEKGSRPEPLAVDSYDWDTRDEPPIMPNGISGEERSPEGGPSSSVIVGVSRLHRVIMAAELKMEPIYWSPINDISNVVRGTWFYRDTMLPVETAVANMLEAGYVALQPWTQTWQDELSSAVETGAAGEVKILHKLWPDIPVATSHSRPGTSRSELVGTMTSDMTIVEPDTPAKQRERDLEAACEIIDASAGTEGPDNKAVGDSTYGRYGPTRDYPLSGVIYANRTDAYILKPSLQPSTYYGRKPLANYIRKGRKLGVPVVRGFDQSVWEKLNPTKHDPNAIKAREGVSSSQAGADPRNRKLVDDDLAQSLRPKVTDLILVIHGIGQKLSQRVESYHFTHAINSFRREVNVELGTKDVRANLRKDAGGIMVLPVNWRHSLSFEEGGYRNEDDDSNVNRFTLKDITPDTLPSVRNIVSDVMLDIPYYLSHHQPRMIAAVVGEANRIYKLWCTDNPGFASEGRVHLIAHSLGSVMAMDVLSQQPTTLPESLKDPTMVDLTEIKLSHFLFNTTNLFTAGSPAGFFILLKRASLLPRIDREKPNTDPAANNDFVCGEAGPYGCIAVDNIYNIINPYDPVAYRLNAAVDKTYAAGLKPAWIPSAISGWFSSSSWFSASTEGTILAAKGKVQNPALPRLPSNLELETHNFSHEEIAEKRMYMLNDNGQIDFLLKYGGGPLEIQYLTMLGAHSSYWLSKDFVRMIVLETGRRPGREGALMGMRAVKRKAQLS